MTSIRVKLGSAYGHKPTFAESKKREAPLTQNGNVSPGSSLRIAELSTRTPAKGYPSLACRLHFVDKVTLDAGLGMMLVDRFGVRGVQHAIDLVVLLAKQDVVVRDPELVRRRVLQLVQLVRRERRHGMGIDKLRHGCNLLLPFGGFAAVVVTS